MDARCRLAVVLALVVGAEARALDLVGPGKPAASIIVAADAPGAERLAASELQAYLEAISGVRPAIGAEPPKQGEAVILVGQGAVRLAGQDVLAASHFDEIADDGYAITVLPNRTPPCLVLVGKKPRGTLYAVYELLETVLGCGFFTDGEHVPRQAAVSVPALNVLGNPALAVRCCWLPTRFYGPKRFQAALWDASDAKTFLRWMARKKLNCLAVEFTGPTRLWGAAFDQAFPEARRFKTEVMDGAGVPATDGETVRMGWGVAPDETTKLWKEVFDYARNTLGIEVIYVVRVGEFEQPLKLARPELKWLASPDGSTLGVAGQNPSLAPADPACRELQARLWKAILDTYGTGHAYLVQCRPYSAPLESAADAGRAIALAMDILRSLDPKATFLISASDEAGWGATQAEKTAFLRRLPPEVTVLYVQEGFQSMALHRATEGFAGHAFHFAPFWGGAGNDLYENRFSFIRNLCLYSSQLPHGTARGFWNYSEVRGANPLLDNASAEYAWSGLNTWASEGAANNPNTRRYLGRRYGPSVVFSMAEALKQALRGAPRASLTMNYRAYAQWNEVRIDGVASARAAVAMAVGCKPGVAESRFYERDLVDLGRNYLHQYIQYRYGQVFAIVRSAKVAAEANTYSPEVRSATLAQLDALEVELLRAHNTLTRLIATRKDMCLDEAILQATARPGSNKALARAIREQQSGSFAEGYPLTDSIEYHQQLKARQIRHLLDYARRELAAPTAKPVPSWTEFFLHGVRDFIESCKPVAYDEKAERTPPSQLLQEFLLAAE